MSISQIKNLNRRLDNLEIEAISELDKVCGSQLWRTMGFEAFDSIENIERRATANYYFGQYQVVKELKSTFG